MKKRVLLALLLIVCLIAFVGCSKKDDGMLDDGMIRDYDHDGLIEDMDDGVRDLGDDIQRSYDDAKDDIRDGVRDGVNDWDDVVDDVRDGIHDMTTTDGVFYNNGEPKLD